jgi:hypothetical protein
MYQFDSCETGTQTQIVDRDVLVARSEDTTLTDHNTTTCIDGTTGIYRSQSGYEVRQTFKFRLSLRFIALLRTPPLTLPHFLFD